MSLKRKSLLSLAIVCLTWLLAAGEALGQQAAQSLKRPKVLTPMTPTELLSTLRQAHIDEYGTTPSTPRLAMAWAQVALENAQGSIVWNHNLGNVGPSRPTHEWYQHSPLTRYRAFDNFIDGGRVYWRVVTWCRVAMANFDAGRPQQATENLKRCGYFEADLEPYIAGMSRLYHYALTKVIPDEARERREKEQLEQAWAEYQLTHQYTPACACTRL